MGWSINCLQLPVLLVVDGVVLDTAQSLSFLSEAVESFLNFSGQIREKSLSTVMECFTRSPSRRFTSWHFSMGLLILAAG